MKVALLAILMLFATTANAETLTHVESSATWRSPWDIRYTNRTDEVVFSASWDWSTDSNSVVANSIIATSSLGDFASFTFYPSQANFFTGDGHQFQVYAYIYNLIHRASIFSAPGEYAPFWNEGIFLWGPGVAQWMSMTPVSYLSVTPIVTPEPGTWAMLLLGLVLLYVLYCYNQKVGNVVQLVRGKW